MEMAPLTPERFADLEAIFNARGCSVARGCWCMFYRRTGRPGTTAWPRRETNRRDLRKAVNKGEFIGLIGYREGAPVGWISFGPREGYRRLERSRVMAPVDDERVWSVICFVVPKEHRGEGVARQLLHGAIRHARKRRAKWLEAYPVDAPSRQDDAAMWFGAASMYRAAGFVEVARRKPARPVMRLRLRRAP